MNVRVEIAARAAAGARATLDYLSAEATIKKLEERCEWLEAENDTLRDLIGVDTVPPGFLGVSPTERMMLSMLLRRDFLPSSMMTHSRRVLMHHLRKKLAGIAEIITLHREGYTMPKRDRERLLRWASEGRFSPFPPEVTARGDENASNRVGLLQPPENGEM